MIASVTPTIAQQPAPQAALTLIDPLGPITQGQQQCLSPDTAHKLCHTLATFTRNADGSYTNKAVTLISQDQPVTIETASEVVIQDKAICAQIKADHYNNAVIRVNGAAAPKDMADPLISKLANATVNLTGHILCARYIQNGSQILSQRAIDGVYNPQLDQLMLWVSPADGYKVAPVSIASPPSRPAAPSGR
jgi:hypothetical protein